MITGFLKRIAIYIIRFYRMTIPPLHPPVCRFTPSCSRFAEEAIERYGIARGSSMALKRLLRCHPFSRGGYDPVR